MTNPLKLEYFIALDPDVEGDILYPSLQGKTRVGIPLPLNPTHCDYARKIIPRGGRGGECYTLFINYFTRACVRALYQCNGVVSIAAPGVRLSWRS